jgi:glycosyltransferase involved in cell wall biosynthesis
MKATAILDVPTGVVPHLDRRPGTAGRRKRLLTISHSYCVSLNRRLPQELARTGDWEVTAVGPSRFRGDFGWHVLERGADEPCEVVPLPVRFSRPVHVMRYGRDLAPLLARPWDLVHCWEEPYVASTAQIARLLAPGVPLVCATFQNIDKRYPPPFSWFERRVMARAAGVIAFGETSAAVLAKRAFDRQPIAVIPPGVDTRMFRPDEGRRRSTLTRLGWADAAPVVGFVGRLVPEKGLAVFTETLDRVRVPWRALVVGSGPLEGRLSDWAAGYGDRVRIVAAAHDEVPAYLNAMDVLCAPSRTTGRWQEQFGRMLIEAFASGVAVIASSSGEIPHVVRDAGMLLRQDDVAAWREAIESLLTDAARRRELAARGRSRAESTYAWPVVARRHLEFFEHLLAQGAVRPC